MATVRHVTLVADTVATVSLNVNAGRIEVLNRTGTAEVYFTTDGSAPTVGGNNCYVLPAAISALEVPDEISGMAVVKLISVGTPSVSVRALR